LKVILDEAYFMLAAWSELDRQLAYLEVLHGNPDMHAQVHSMEEIRMTAANTNNCLTKKIGESWWAAPNIRKTLRRVEEDGTGKSFLEPIKLLSVTEVHNEFILALEREARLDQDSGSHVLDIGVNRSASTVQEHALNTFAISPNGRVRSWGSTAPGCSVGKTSEYKKCHNGAYRLRRTAQ
jgi:hypothetical protein